jgi:hypothetical protein
MRHRGVPLARPGAIRWSAAMAFIVRAQQCISFAVPPWDARSRGRRDPEFRNPTVTVLGARCVAHSSRCNCRARKILQLIQLDSILGRRQGKKVSILPTAGRSLGRVFDSLNIVKQLSRIWLNFVISATYGHGDRVECKFLRRFFVRSGVRFSDDGQCTIAGAPGSGTDVAASIRPPRTHRSGRPATNGGARRAMVRNGATAQPKWHTLAGAPATGWR